MTIKLSICIPTYNRGDYIAETLRSIIPQLTDEVELVVSDNASSDETEAIVHDLCGRLPHFRYFRAAQNMGADRNFLKVIEIASGEYCWFMGSDDIVEAGAVSVVMDRLSRHPGLAGISVNRYAYKVDLSSKILERPVAGGVMHADRLFTDAEETFSTLGEYLGYLPGQIVDRKLWASIVAEADLTPYYNAYVHVYVIARMLQKRPHWLYLHERCAGWRSGNDSFMSEGRLKRMSIDVVGFEKIAGDVFGRQSAPYISTMNIVSTVHVKSALLGAKAMNAPTQFFVRALKLCLRFYWRFPMFWLKTFPVFCMPRFVYVGARAIYRSTLKPLRLRRLNSL